MHQTYPSLKAVLGRTGKDVIQLQNSRDIKATEWKQGSKYYFKFLKILISIGNLLWMQINYFINAL